MGHSMSLEAPRAPRVEEPVLLGMASRVPAVGRGVAFNSKLTSPGVPAATPAAPPPQLPLELPVLPGESRGRGASYHCHCGPGPCRAAWLPGPV